MRNQSRYRPQGGNPRRRDNRPPPSLPHNYLANGYFDGKNNLLPQVIQDWPMELAGTFLRNQPRLNTAQLRRFYNKVTNIKQRLDSGQSFDNLKEEIYSLGYLSANAVGRGNAPDIFKEFMDRTINYAVQSPDHFRRGFKTHFESIVAYVKYQEEKS